VQAVRDILLKPLGLVFINEFCSHVRAYDPLVVNSVFVSRIPEPPDHPNKNDGNVPIDVEIGVQALPALSR
jgi:hypothetical protein